MINLNYFIQQKILTKIEQKIYKINRKITQRKNKHKKLQNLFPFLYPEFYGI